MKKYICILSFFIVFLTACDERGFITYHGGRFISFMTDYKQDSVISSFFFNPSLTEIDVPIVLQLAGLPLEEDEKFSISVVEEETTADPTNYSIQPEYTFRAGLATDTITVKLLKSDLLNEGRVRLVLQVDGSDILQPGQSNLRKAKLIFSNLADKPDWWKDEIETVYLGEYSAEKYQAFIKAVGQENADLSEKESTEVWDLARKFKYWLREKEEAGTPVLDADRKPIKVPVVG